MKKILLILLLTAFPAAFLFAKDDRQEPVRPDKTKRGLVNMSQNFVPKGQWITGLNASFSTHENDRYNLVLINGIDSDGHTINISPMLGYAIKDNVAIGVKFGYARNLLRIDDGGLSFGSGDNGISLGVDSYYSLKHTYEGAFFWRRYIPFGGSKRFALFAEAQLVLGGSQAKYAAHLPVKGTYETSFSTALNVTPGIVAFIANDVAVELNVGMMGVTFTTVDQVHNQVATGNRRYSNMNFKVNVLAIGLGLAIYL